MVHGRICSWYGLQALLSHSTQLLRPSLYSYKMPSAIVLLQPLDPFSGRPSQVSFLLCNLTCRWTVRCGFSENVVLGV